MIKNIIKSFIFLFFISSSFSLLAQITAPIEIRKIQPPKLGQEHIGKKIICYRPVRKGGPKMSIEAISHKIVVHNYGHGGGGWSLGPGSANYVVNELEKTPLVKNLSKTTPITIIGAGALGLLTAYTLVNKGYQHITVVADNFDNLTSHNAGAVFSPGYGVETEDQQSKDLFWGIGLDSLKFYQAIARKQHPFFKEGAREMPEYFQPGVTADFEAYVGKGIQPAKNVILDFGNGKAQPMIVYDDGIYIDTHKMMTLLNKHLKGKVKFVKNKVKHFSEIKDEIIINCAGLGAKELNADEALIPVQGHLLLLKDQNPKELEYLIIVDGKDVVNSHGQKTSRMFYLFPKRASGANPNDIGVLGGTYVEGATSLTPNDEEFDVMLQQAREFYGV